MSKTRIQYMHSVKLKREEKFFGKGVVTLLRKTEETGSIRKAARSMEMSYNKAQKILHLAQENLDFPLLHSEIGGAGGGGSRMTDEAKVFIDTFYAFEQETDKAVNQIFQKYYGCEDDPICAVLMLSGLSRRYGQANKLLIPFNGKPLYQHLFDLVRECPFQEVIAVSDDPAILADARGYGFTPVRNRWNTRGISAAIKLGIQECRNAGGWMFLTGDQPLLTKETVLSLINAFRKYQTVVVPEYNSQKGSPCIFPRQYYEDLLMLEGDEGGMQIIRSLEPEAVFYQQISRTAEAKDIDSEDDRIELMEYIRNTNK